MASRIEPDFSGGFSSRAVYYYHKDHLGSSTYMTDGAGVIREQAEYTPWGETWDITNNTLTYVDFLYTGKERDATGLYYFGARYYDPRISLWLSADPILDRYIDAAMSNNGLKGVFDSTNLSLFSYARNSPIRFVDPDGNEAEQAATPMSDEDWIANEVQRYPNTIGTCKSIQDGVQSAYDSAATLHPIYAASEAISGETASGKKLTKGEQALAIGTVGTPILGKLFAKVAKFFKIGINIEKVSLVEKMTKELKSGEGVVIAGAGHKTALRKAEELSKKYGGNPSDWQKVSSKTFYKDPKTGVTTQIHGYQNPKINKYGVDLTEKNQ